MSLFCRQPSDCAIPASVATSWLADRMHDAHILLATIAALAASLAHAAGPVDFEREVAPILLRRCVECHRGSEPAGSLDLTSAKGIEAGGASGAALVAGDSGASHLVRRVVQGEMPPDEKGQSQELPQKEIDVLRHWISEGAKWPADRVLQLFERTTDIRAGLDWWSLQPITRPSVPENHGMSQHPVDAFVHSRLRQNQMAPAPQADKRTLLRRLYYDLIGLPPTEEEIHTFIADTSQNAWERQIDLLLARPQYGERWARHWLDLARFAETSGYERDQEKLFAWKYRDWVVSALNNDIPYSQFIVWQLAGDEIQDRTEASVIATGFLRLGTWNDEPNDPLDYQYDRLEDLIHTTSSTFLALTVKCARCHTHKFDPIQQDDYYRMGAAFWSGPIGARDRKLLGGPTTEELGFKEVLGWTDLSPTPPPLRVLKKGERIAPMHTVAAGSLSSIPSLQRDFESPPEGSKTTTRRLQLAKWIADPRNPLTSRVLVNRLWQHHFGAAIVRTPNNFGFLSDPPTHPELLNWLAAEFIERGGSIKAMHKLLLTSETWRQSSLHPQANTYTRKDSGNRLWWRAERRRLDAESLRDSMLAASGELDLTLGGPSFKASVSPEALEGLSRKASAWQASPPEAQKRRSLYMYMKRHLLPPMMTAFDLCDATQSVGQRDVTIVPTQALALLNNRFAHDRSEYLARQIIETTNSEVARIESAWSSILRRAPTASERKLAQQHRVKQLARFQDAQRDGTDAEVLALASLCHVLFNSNEFIYVD